MRDKPFVDTNVLVYTLKKDDPRAWVAEQLLTGGVVVGVQTLNEMVHVCLRKLKMPWAETLKAVELVRVLCPSPVPVTMEIHAAALRIVRRFGFDIFDALLIAAAHEADCTTFYSEDMHDGQVIDGLTIRNPFRENRVQ